MLSRILQDFLTQLIAKYIPPDNNFCGSDSLSKTIHTEAINFSQAIINIPLEDEEDIESFRLKIKKLAKVHFEREEAIFSSFEKLNKKISVNNDSYLAFEKNFSRCLHKLKKLWLLYELNDLRWLVKKDECIISNFLYLCLEFEMHLYIKEGCPKLTSKPHSLGHEKGEMLLKNWQKFKVNLNENNFSDKFLEIFNIIIKAREETNRIQSKSLKTWGLSLIKKTAPDCLQKGVEYFTGCKLDPYNSFLYERLEVFYNKYKEIHESSPSLNQTSVKIKIGI